MAVASYDAQINLLVSGQRELDRLTDRLRSIERQIVDINRLGVKPQQRDPVTGRFGADPDRENRIRLARIQRIGKEEERRARLTSASLRTQNSELERSILLQSKLNSAVDLYERKLEELSRGGGGARLGEDLQAQIRDIRAAYQAATDGGTKNLSLVRSLATELGRVVERQNEINRLSSFQSKAFYDTQRFERRIAELRRAGADASAFSGVGGQMKALRSAQARGNESEAKDATRRIREALDRIARNLDETIREARTQQSAQKAARSWETFFEEASTTALLLKQNQKNASAKFAQFFEDAANQALQISQNAKDTRKSWQFFFEDAQKEADRLRTERLSNFARLRGNPNQYSAEAGPLPASRSGSPRYFAEAKEIFDKNLEIRQSAKDTSDAWRVFFEDTAAFALQLKQNAKDTSKKWTEFFQDASYQALQIKENNKSTRKSWQVFFEDAASQALLIKQQARETTKSWQGFFEDAANQALQIKQNAKATAQSWRSFFENAASEALRVSQEAKNTSNNWRQFFEDAAYQALQIKQNGKDTSESWRVFFEDAAYEAFSIKEKAKSTRSSWQQFFEDAELEAKRLRGGKKTGLQSALEKLQEARSARQTFFGSTSPAEAIDKIVREFGTKKDIGAGVGTNVTNALASEITAGTSKAAAAGTALGDAVEDGLEKGLEIKSPSGVALRIARNVVNTLANALNQGKFAIQAASEALFSSLKGEGDQAKTELEQTFGQFRKQFSSLTTKPRYFNRLLSKIPDTGLTVEMAGAATDVFNKIKLPDILEGQIKEAYIKEFGKLPSFFADLVNEIKDLLNKVLPSGVGGGGRPPVPPGNGGGAGGAGDFNRRLAEAVQQGPQALLGLEELRQPARASINELNALSGVLTELRSVLDPTAAGFDRLDDQLRETLANIDRQLERRDPNADPLTRRFGPRTGRAISEGLIGGAFPLLFGQGAGASLGGLLGGAAGGFAGGGLGFGLSLVGTALGTALDQLGAAAAEAGKALRDPIAGFEKLKEANLLASKAQEFYIQKLIESGRVTQASAVIQSEIIKKIGVTGVNDLNKLGESSSKLSKAWAEFNLQLQAAVAGPLAKLLDWVTSILSVGNQFRKDAAFVEDVRGGLSGKDKVEFDKRKKEITDLLYRSIAFGGITRDEAAKREKQLAEEFAGRSKPQIRGSQEDPETRENAIKAAQQAADEIKQAYRTAFSLQRQAADIERQAADNRRRVEEDIFRKRQEAARLENDNARTAAQIRIESADLAIRKGFAGAEGEARTVLDAVREAIKARATAEADIEQKRRELEINLADLQRESSNYIYEQAMSRMQLERSIEDYKMQVADFQLENQRKIQALQATAQAGIAAGDFTIANIASTNRTPEERAALATVQYAEGTYGAADPYRVMFGGGTFNDLSRHPDRVVRAGGYASAAAGAYQFMPDTWNRQLGGGAMTPVRQDAGAIALMRGANADVNREGFSREFANKIAPIWAAVPTLAGTSYYPRQRAKRYEDLKAFYDRQLAFFKGQPQQQALSPIFTWPQTPRAEGSVREGQMVGGATPIQQYQQAESTVRPVRASLEANTQGFLQAESQIKKITRERLQLEKQLSDLGLQGITYGIREAAQGESNILATENQLQLETKRLDLIKSSGLLSQNQLAIESKRLENSAQIQLLKSYETQALEYVNKLATEGVMMNGKLVKITKQEADLYTNEIRTGFEKRIENARIQLNIEAEILQYQQQQAIAERQSAIEREIALSGIGLKFGYIGEAARAFKESLDLGATIQQAQEYADAVQRLQDLPGRKVSEAYDESAVALQRLVDSENQAIFAAQTISDAFSGAFREIIAGTATAQEILSGFFQSLANSFADMAAQIIAEMIKMYILKQLLNLFGAAGGGSTGLRKTLEGIASYGYANGGVFANSIKPFAMGGVVNSPTLFKFANGGAMNTGVMGEAGPEAILPLSRGSDGKLGVSASGSGGDVNVTVNVDAKGTSVQGNDQSGNQLGRAISAAVQQEIIKQRRPGGLLNK